MRLRSQNSLITTTGHTPLRLFLCSASVFTVVSAIVLVMSCAKSGPKLAMPNEEVRFTQVTTEGAGDVDWSPDGKWLAFSSDDIWIKPVTGGEAIQITKDPAYDIAVQLDS